MIEYRPQPEPPQTHSPKRAPDKRSPSWFARTAVIAGLSAFVAFMAVFVLIAAFLDWNVQLQFALKYAAAAGAVSSLIGAGFAFNWTREAALHDWKIENYHLQRQAQKDAQLYSVAQSEQENTEIPTIPNIPTLFRSGTEALNLCAVICAFHFVYDVQATRDECVPLFGTQKQWNAANKVLKTLGLKDGKVWQAESFGACMNLLTRCEWYENGSGVYAQGRVIQW